MRAAFLGITAAGSVAMGGACGGEFSASSADDGSRWDSATQEEHDISIGSGGTGGTGGTRGTGGASSTGGTNVGGTAGENARTDGAEPAPDVGAGGEAGIPHMDASDSGRVDA